MHIKSSPYTLVCCPVLTGFKKKIFFLSDSQYNCFCSQFFLDSPLKASNTRVSPDDKHGDRILCQGFQALGLYGYLPIPRQVPPPQDSGCDGHRPQASWVPAYLSSLPPSLLEGPSCPWSPRSPHLHQDCPCAGPFGGPEQPGEFFFLRLIAY